MQQHRATILVVDDEFLIRVTLVEYLQDCGFEVAEAASAQEAVHVLESRPIDLVLTDVRMPGDMDGFGLARWIRAHRPGILVIVMSGNMGKAAAARELCAEHAFIDKPFALERVAEQVGAALERRSGQS